MATQGGSGTLKPPGDDHVAPVIPLRHRQTEPAGAPTGGKLLPRERAAFDPELELEDDALPRRRWPRAALVRVPRATTRLHIRPHFPATAAVLAAVTAAAVIAAGVLGSQVFTSPGARRPATVAQHPPTQVVQSQLTDANADRSRHWLASRTAATHRARVQHHRARTRATTRHSARSPHQGGSAAPTTTAAADGVATPQSGASSDARSNPTGSATSGVSSASGSTNATSSGTGAPAEQATNLPPGPTGIGSATGCNPKCS